MSAILGIDVGEKKIGIAIGRREDGWAFARPPLLVDSWDSVWPQLRELIAKESVDCIVVGLPLELTGQIGSQAERVRQFIDTLRTHTSVPIVERDERRTSQAVQKEQVGQKLQRGQEDSLAAQLLVESYLTEKAHD